VISIGVFGVGGVTGSTSGVSLQPTKQSIESNAVNRVNNFFIVIGLLKIKIKSNVCYIHINSLWLQICKKKRNKANIFRVIGCNLKSHRLLIREFGVLVDSVGCFIDACPISKKKG
jgi:hypothetical protein